MGSLLKTAAGPMRSDKRDLMILPPVSTLIEIPEHEKPNRNAGSKSGS